MNERSLGYLVRTEPSATMNRVTVGRVPRGQLSAAPTYWTGRGWSADPAAAVPVIETADRMVNATQFVRSNNTWMAITVVAEIRANPRCEAPRCNTYFASWIPTTVPGQLMFAMSHNQ